MGNTSHHIENSKHIANEMASIMIEQDDMFLSHDAMSLVTNIPIYETLDIIKKRLEDDIELKLRTNLNVDDIMELLMSIIASTCLSYRGTNYPQKFGIARLENLVIKSLETNRRYSTAATPPGRVRGGVADHHEQQNNVENSMIKFLVMKLDRSVTTADISACHPLRSRPIANGRT